MKNLNLIIVILLLMIPGRVIPSGTPPPEASLSGRITDKKTGESLAGVIVYFPDLKTGTVSDLEGRYSISKLPRTSLLVQLSYISYRSIIVTVDLRIVSEQDFEMEYTATELNEVVITGLSKSAEQKRTPTPITVISRMALLQHASSNIIDAVASQPGISQITTGSAISKPVIRGLGYNRVVVINDGIRQEGQQWGDEHGIEIDEYAINRVEILKGPASLAFGSDALAGVINLIPAPSPDEGSIRGTVAANYQTNNGLAGISVNMAGNISGFIWDARFSNKISHAYKNAYDGYVFNSGWRENSANLLLGFIKPWGYSHVNFSIYNLTPGIVEGERDSATGDFTRLFPVGDTLSESRIATDDDLLSYTPYTPYQKIHHFKVVWNSNFIFRNGSLKTAFGLQQNHRKEFGNVLSAGNYDLYFLLNTFTYDLRYIFPEVQTVSLSVGLNGMRQDSKNRGDEFLVPEYSLFDAGFFVLFKKNLRNVDLSGGIRFDTRMERARELYLDSLDNRILAPAVGSLLKFPGFKSQFNGFSGSLGATWQITKSVFTKFNISRGFRAPNIGELGVNGIHEGTLRYEIGDPGLSPEHSLQLDYIFGITTEHIAAEIDIFSSTINNYIYLRKLSSATGGDSISGDVSTFRYVAGNARLSGGEVRVDIHPHPYDWVHVENSFSFVMAVQKDQPDSSRHLPFIPAPKWQSSVRIDIKGFSKTIRNSYLQVTLEKYFKQGKYYSAFNTETGTPGYVLMNLGLGTDLWRNGKNMCSVYFTLNNLADVAYQSHLSRLKYSELNFATQRRGVFNMGRNFSLKLIIPVSIR
jgi:iron complex outermembrane receptor protein